MRKNSGVTLVALAITISVILLIVGVGTYSGMESVRNAKYTKFKSELKIMQSYVNNWYEELAPANVYANDYDEQLIQNIANKFESQEVHATKASSGITALQAINDTDYSNYYILDTEQKTALKVEGVEQKVLVNIKKRKVVSFDGMENEKGTKTYTLDNNEGIYNVEFSRESLPIRDKDAPNITISMAKSSDYLFAIKSTISLSDQSELDYSKCKYIYTNSSAEVGTDASLYTDGTINTETATIEKPKGAGTYYLHVLATDAFGNAAEAVSSNSVTIEDKKDFDYTGTVQSGNLMAGSYKLEVWGAQGIYSSASYSNTWNNGKGAYAKGTINLPENKLLYVYVGGRPYYGAVGGVTSQYNGGYNGGGASYQGSSYNDNGPGGGATDIALIGGECTFDSYKRYVRTQDSYLSRIIVAGGGGGGRSGQSYCYGGYAPTTSTSSGNYWAGMTSAGGNTSSYQAGGFGYGSSGTSTGDDTAGGGGGWYGRRMWRRFSRWRRFFICMEHYICTICSERIYTSNIISNDRYTMY